MLRRASGRDGFDELCLLAERVAQRWDDSLYDRAVETTYDDGDDYTRRKVFEADWNAWGAGMTVTEAVAARDSAPQYTSFDSAVSHEYESLTWEHHVDDPADLCLLWIGWTLALGAVIAAAVAADRAAAAARAAAALARLTDRVPCVWESALRRAADAHAPPVRQLIDDLVEAPGAPPRSRVASAAA